MKKNKSSVIAIITTSLMFAATVFAVPENVLAAEDLAGDGVAIVGSDMSDMTSEAALSEDGDLQVSSFEGDGAGKIITEEIKPEQTDPADTDTEAAATDVLETDSSTFTNPTMIDVNKEYTDKVASEAFDNYYKFTLKSAGYVSFDFAHDLFGDNYDWWVLGLYDPKVSNVDPLLEYRYLADQNATTHSTGTGLPAGDYILSIDAKSDCVSKQFKFKVNYTASSAYETEINDDAAKADPISVNSQYSGTIRRTESVNFSDKDYYRFSLTKPGYVDITFSHGYVNEDDDFWKIELYDENDLNTPFFTRRSLGNNSNKITYNGTGLPAGNYYLVISQNGPYWSGEVYNFTVNFTASTSYETELNDTVDTADPIVPNVQYAGNIMEHGDTDYYQFTLDKKCDVSFTFAHDYVDLSNPWIVSVYNYNDPEKALISKHIEGEQTKPYTSDKVRLSSGKYLVKVERGGNTSDTIYHLTVNDGQLAATSKLTATNEAKGIKLSYKKVTGATKYLIYRDGKKIATVSGNSNVKYTDKSSLKNGKKYTYKVVAANDSVKSSKSKSVVIYRLDQGKLSSVKKSGKKAAKVKWKKNSKASGYEIEYARNSKFTSSKKSVTINKANKDNKKISGLKNGKKYYFRIRSYITKSGKKYYSAWSATKSVK